MKKKGIHVETTMLVIPELNDNESQIRSMVTWHLKALGPDVPLHFSRFHPCYKFTHVPATPVSTIIRSRELALSEGVRYVYVGNVPGDSGENTYCPNCKSLLVERFGYQISAWNLDRDNNCSSCGTPIAIVGQREKLSSSVFRQVLSD